MFARINESGVVVEYPVYAGAIRNAHPNVSFPQSMPAASIAEYGYVPVTSAPMPTPARLQKVEERLPVLHSGQWTQVWAVVDMSPAEIVVANQLLQADIAAQTQERLDAFARTRNYDDIKSACTYAGCSVPRFNAEGSYCQDKRAETWDKLYQILAEVEAGTRPMPGGYGDVEPELPALVWPI